MMSILGAILSGLGKVFPVVLKVLGPVLTPVLIFLGLGWLLRDPMAEIVGRSLTTFSILVGLGLCIYFVLKGVSWLWRRG